MSENSSESIDELIISEELVRAQCVERRENQFCPFNHFKAILYRRSMNLLRAKKYFIITSLLVVLFSILTIVLQFIMKKFIKSSSESIGFNTYFRADSPIAIIENKASRRWNTRYKNILKDMYYEEMQENATFIYFENASELNNYTYQTMLNGRKDDEIFVGIEFVKQYPYIFNIFYNGSQLYPDGSDFGTEVILTRMTWKFEFGKKNDFRYTETQLTKRTIELQFGLIGPVLIAAGIISIIPLVLQQPIVDISGETRDYMISCGLKVFPYWLATFLVDFLIWTIVTTIVWGIFLVFKVRSYLDNMFTTWYIFFLAGPSFLLMVYSISFLYNSVETATRQVYIGLAFLLILPLIIDLVRKKQVSFGVEVIYSFFPHVSIMRLLSRVLVNISLFSKSFSYYWNDDERTRVHFIMQFVDFFIYGTVLFCIERFRTIVHEKSTHQHFKKNIEVFRRAKERHPVTSETNDMVARVDAGEDFAVKIFHCSRIFSNAQGIPIPAVNDVCLGIKKGSTFGFLGANGAGKTTLIKIITGIIPPSNGDVYINGKSVQKGQAKGLVAICPQFNTHLCMDMTPDEHFKLYSMLAELSPMETKNRIDTILDILELDTYRDRIVGEMSGGQQRRLAVALAFFGDSEIILLDEPTSSLDPYARHKVHNLIKHFQGSKTFMLCTHLLGEAEILCDNISIMSRGNIFTCGSPQYLTTKFGTEHKIDIMLDQSEMAEHLCDAFFEQRLPQAKLSIMRPGARIYSVLASEMRLSQLFRIMREGKNSGNGFNYFTCSTSSLERVFLEIVKMSENDDITVCGEMP